PTALRACSPGMVTLSTGESAIVRPFSPPRLIPGVEVKPRCPAGASGPRPAFRGVRAVSGPSALFQALAPVALGDVIERALLHVADLVQEVEDVLLAAEVDVVGLDHEERGRLV